ncbi:hypothetical protein D3C78_1484020 [compost metagenome]
MAVGIQLNVTCAGSQGTVKLHADPGLGADQLDRPCVHAAQCAGVDGQLWRVRRVGSAGGSFEGAGVDIIGAGDHLQFVGVDPGIDPGTAGDDFETVDIARVKPRAFDGNTALIHLVMGDLAVLDHRLAGTERRPWGIDKATTITADAVRVGYDDMG